MPVKLRSWRLFLALPFKEKLSLNSSRCWRMCSRLIKVRWGKLFKHLLQFSTEYVKNELADTCCFGHGGSTVCCWTWHFSSSGKACVSDCGQQVHWSGRSVACKPVNPRRSFSSIIVWRWCCSLRNHIKELSISLPEPKHSRSCPSSWCRTFPTAGGIFCNTSFLSFVRISIFAAVFGWPMIGPFVSTRRPHSSLTARAWTLNCLIFMQ